MAKVCTSSSFAICTKAYSRSLSFDLDYLSDHASLRMEMLEVIFDDANTHTHTQKTLHFLDVAKILLMLLHLQKLSV